MPDFKECPMCGGDMRQETRERRDKLPGERQRFVRNVREWVCRDCDYFEEVLED